MVDVQEAPAKPAAAAALPQLLVFADDWGRHPSSCQHLMRQLLGRYGVTWVNTIGMRTPRLDWATVSRGLEKLRHWSRPRAAQHVEPLPEHLRVVNPRMWPWFSSQPSRWLNRTMLSRQLTNVIRGMPSEPVAVTTLPITADLVGVLPVKRWVYYCVDDFSQWPGLDQRTLQRLDEELIRRVDVCVAVSETLRERIRGLGRDANLLTHGVDVEFWQSGGAGVSVPELDGLPRPLVVFWGVVDRRMDVAFLHRLAAEMREGTVVVIGPWNDADPALPLPGKVVHVRPLAFEQLPAVAREAGVLVMPYADLPVTRAIQPLKMKEYLATGRPVVMRDLPATRPWADCLDLVQTAEGFSEAVRRRLAEGVPPAQEQAREARLRSEGWAAKAHDLERWALE